MKRWYLLFTSAENNQVSSWYPEKQHRMFTYFFLKAIIGEADFNQDNQITFQEIYNFIAHRAEGVPYYSKRLHGGRIQTPTIHAANNDRVNLIETAIGIGIEFSICS